MTEQNLPAAAEPRPSSLELLAASQGMTLREYAGTLPPALVMLLDPGTNAELKLVAHDMAKAEGMVPKHLLGKPAACFAVITRSITWRLDPYAVALATYETPGGRVGFEGKLVQAILERSGKFDGPIRFEHFGDWDKVAAKGFTLKSWQSGKPFPVAGWGPADAKASGAGVLVRGKVKGEVEPREWTVRLDQCFPLNSTLWATDPKTQICYVAVRRFANLAAPSLLMGAPFEDDAAGEMVEVNPQARPEPTQHRAAARRSRPPVTDAIVEDAPAPASAPAEPVQAPMPDPALVTGEEAAAEASASEAGSAEPSGNDEAGDEVGETLQGADEQGGDEAAGEAAPGDADFDVWVSLENGWREAFALCKSLDELDVREKEWREWLASPKAKTAPEDYAQRVSNALVSRKLELTPRRKK